MIQKRQNWRESTSCLERKNRLVQDVVNKRSQTPQASRWFALSGGLLALFLVYTALLRLHVFSVSTFRAEQWLLHRPLTQLECTFVEWQNLGDALVSLG